MTKTDGKPRKKEGMNNHTRKVFKKPWVKHYYLASKRVRLQKSYIGLPFTITKEDVKEIWFRDKAYELDRPSIDKICDKKGYLPENCRFIELIDNIRKGATGKKFSKETRKKLSIKANERWDKKGRIQGCIVTCCTNPHRAKGLCSQHYFQKRWQDQKKARTKNEK